jgi:glycine hydroxymethyltransferase
MSESDAKRTGVSTATDASLPTAPTDVQVFSRKSQAYLDDVEAKVKTLSPAAVATRITSLVQEHDRWRATACLNMNPAEGLISTRARVLLASDMATRLTEGLPGDKTYPNYLQNRFIDEIEATIIALVRRQFGARYVEWRPMSNSMANAAVFFALLRPGDSIFVQDMDAGGNYSYQTCGPAGLTQARIATIPAVGKVFEIDVDWVRTCAKKLRPKMIVIGGGKVLFPYPVRELREIADSIGALLVYDAAHVGLLISHGIFQRPLQEGAHVVTLSTHKIMGGPVGGIVLTDDTSIAKAIISRTFPGLMQTRDQNKYAALAVGLAELEHFGTTLARATVANAVAFAAAMAGEGFTVLARDGIYTQTHQCFLDLGHAAQTFDRRCQAVNILASDCSLTGDSARDRRSGMRLATHELTRLGMGVVEMREVAQLIARATRDEADVAAISADVAALISRFPGDAYSLSSADASC